MGGERRLCGGHVVFTQLSLVFSISLLLSPSSPTPRFCPGSGHGQCQHMALTVGLLSVCTSFLHVGPGYCHQHASLSSSFSVSPSPTSRMLLGGRAQSTCLPRATLCRARLLPSLSVVVLEHALLSSEAQHSS